jgi:hypothetical protein
MFNKVNIWAIKCYFIAQILAENRAEKTQVGRQSRNLYVVNCQVHVRFTTASN